MCGIEKKMLATIDGRMRLHFEVALFEVDAEVEVALWQQDFAG